MACTPKRWPLLSACVDSLLVKAEGKGATCPPPSAREEAHAALFNSTAPRRPAYALLTVMFPCVTLFKLVMSSKAVLQLKLLGVSLAKKPSTGAAEGLPPS